MAHQGTNSKFRPSSLLGKTCLERIVEKFHSAHFSSNFAGWIFGGGGWKIVPFLTQCGGFAFRNKKFLRRRFCFSFLLFCQDYQKFAQIEPIIRCEPLLCLGAYPKSLETLFAVPEGSKSGREWSGASELNSIFAVTFVKILQMISPSQNCAGKRVPELPDVGYF